MACSRACPPLYLATNSCRYCVPTDTQSLVSMPTAGRSLMPQALECQLH